MISRRLFAVSALAVLTMVATFADVSAHAAKTSKQKRKKPITKLSYDPNAPRVELFKGMEEGTIATKVIMKDKHEGRVLFENLTTNAVTVELPQAVVAQQFFPQILNQIDDGGTGLGGGNDNGGGGNNQQQNTGGGFGGGGQFGGGGGQFGGGGGFFSIPPEKVVAVPLNTVCLEYGKREPSSRSNYKLVKVEDYTEDKKLQEFLKLVATNKIPRNVAQAAAWQITGGLSWQELASKRKNTLGGSRGVAFFSQAELQAAYQVAAMADKMSKEDSKDKKPAKSTRPTIRRSGNLN